MGTNIIPVSETRKLILGEVDSVAQATKTEIQYHITPILKLNS
jgi:hypothetical protein